MWLIPFAGDQVPLKSLLSLWASGGESTTPLTAFPPVSPTGSESEVVGGTMDHRPLNPEGT